MDSCAKTILLVEDEAIIALSVKLWLTREGFAPIHVTSGEKAIETILNGQESIDLILMDIDLGSGCIDGTQAAREILKTHDIPLLFLSSHTEPEIVNKTEQISSYGYVVKGSSNTVLLASMKMAFKLFNANKELKAKQLAISESQQRLRRAEFVSKAGNWELHLDSGMMHSSEGASKIYGLKDTQWKLSEAQRIPLPEYRPILDNALRNLIESGTPYDVEFKIKNAETGEITDIHSIAEYESKDRILFGIIQDITERKRAEEETRQRSKDIATLFNISQLLASTLDMAKILQLIVENAVSLAGLDTGALYMVKGEELYLEATTPPLPLNFPHNFRSTLINDHPFICQAFSTCSSVVVPDISLAEFSPSERKIIEGRNLGSILYIPIILSDRKLGILILGTIAKSRCYSKSEIETYRAMSFQAALAIENARLFQKAQQEISERKLAEEALRKSEESLSITLHSIGDGVIATDINGFVVRMNPMAEKLCGWNFQEATGRPLTEIFHIINAYTRELVANPVDKVLETGMIIGLANHTVLISRDGTEYQIADSAAPICNENGERFGVVLVFSDVTDKYKTEEMLAQSESRFRMLFNNTTNGFGIHEIITDEQDQVIDVKYLEINSVYGILLGVNPKDIKGKTIKQINPETDSEMIKLLGSVALTGKPVDMEYFSKAYKKHFHILAYSPGARQFAIMFEDISKY
ncbi:MAG: PAS domain S-box protein [Methanococcaceae archaeon]